MTDVPHFALPFQWTDPIAGPLNAAEVEQESIAEIGGCCEAILRTVQGERSTFPAFGRPQLEFNSQPETTRALLASALLEFEPRVSSLISAEWDDDDVGVQQVRALIAPADSQEGEQT